MKPFSKLKKQIDNLFVPELKIEFCCYAYPTRTQFGNNSIPRFCIKMGKEVIWDCPKIFSIKEEYIHTWSARNGICDLVRDYIDSPIDKLLEAEFKKDKWECGHIFTNETFIINYHLSEIFKSADRRLGKQKLIEWSAEIESHSVASSVLKKRFSRDQLLRLT